MIPIEKISLVSGKFFLNKANSNAKPILNLSKENNKKLNSHKELIAENE